MPAGTESQTPDLSEARLEDLSGEITVTIQGRTFTSELSNDDYYMADVIRAIRNGKNPADAIAFLADRGARTAEKDSPGNYRQFIGD